MVSFVLGGYLGAVGVHAIGYQFVWPVAVVLFAIGFTSIGYDVKLRLRIWLSRRRKKRRRP